MQQLTLLPARHEILWRDGSSIGIHPVASAGGVPELYLRAVPGPDEQPVIVDLRPLVPGIDQDLARAAQRDRVGLVFFALRHAFPCAREFQAAALQRARVDVLALQHRAAA